MPGLELGLALGDRRGAMPGGFDFTGGAMPAGATLRRASAGWFRGAGGWQAAPADVPRFTCRPGTEPWLAAGLMLEPAATNLCAWSAEPGQPGWVSGGMQVAQGQAGPFGNGAVLVTGDGAASSHIHYTPAVTLTSGVQYVVSRFVRPVGATVRLQLAAGAGLGYAWANFNFASGSVVSVASADAAGIDAMGGGWWRIWLMKTAVATVTANTNTVALIAANGDGRIPANSSTDAFLTAQAQVEMGAKPSSPVVTAGGAGMRAADVLTLDWASRGVADGAVTVRYRFDGGGMQDVPTLVSGGRAAAPEFAGILLSARAA